MSVSTLFRPATRKKVRGRIGLDGPAGAGKTFTALRLAFTLAGERGRVAVVNSESGAVEKYLGLAPDDRPWQFDVCELADFSPSSYTSAILEAGRLGYDVIVVDSLSHAWNGVGGALELVSRKGGNSFTAWKDITPLHNQMVEAILRSPAHLIATIRSKMEYILEEFEDRDGRKKSVPRKVGMAPVQRNGMEYEFDVFADLDHTHTLTVSKTRCPDLDGAIAVKPGALFFAPLVRWLNEGSDVDPSHYIATQEDLQRSMAAREAAAKAAAGHAGNGQPAAEKPSAKELMRRAAAGKQEKVEQPAPVADEQRAPSQEKVADDQSPPFATAEDCPHDHAELIRRIDVYGPQAYGDRWPDAKAAALAKRNVGSLRSLSVDQADELLEKLMAKAMGLEEAKKKQAAAAAGQGS